ncbi:hypothetical protein ACH5Y9_09965 [Methylomonas sp. BW4-1]|uniref:hypothetical protein n=1 Tax=Methylomonas sp. BW4-1 TaxID=3376685 RepID=UPI0040438348
MRNLLAWLKTILHWLVEWRLFCLGFFVVVAPAGFIVFVSTDEAEIRITGILLQLLGTGGLHISTMGALWLAIGVVSSIPSELAV